MRKMVRKIVASQLGIKMEDVWDSTNISTLDPTDLRVALIQKIGVAHGGADGEPATFGELMDKLNEVIQMQSSPNKVTIKVVREPTQN